MKPVKKKALIIAAACLAAGIVIRFAALAAMGFDYVQMGTMKPADHTYTLTEPFTDISVWGGECDVRLLPSSDGTCMVQCGETDRITHTVTVENGTLTVRRTDDRKWYEHIGFFWNYWGSIEVVIYLPESEYESLYIRTASGEVEVPNDFTFAKAEVDGTSGDVRFTAAVTGDMKVKSVSGDVMVDGVQPRSLTVKTTSGDVLIEKVQSGELTVESISGDIELARCDAGSLWIKTVSGDVSGTLLTEKIFITDTTSGSVHVPPGASGGKCEVTTTSGDIRLMVQP